MELIRSNFFPQIEQSHNFHWAKKLTLFMELITQKIKFIVWIKKTLLNINYITLQRCNIFSIFTTSKWI